MRASRDKLYKQAYRLSLFTVFYNIAEGVVAIIIGYNDEALTLFGFGIDSLIEVVSALGIVLMIQHIRKYPDSPVSKFEKTALRITGTAFYVLSAGLFLGIVLNLIQHHKPETTFWGIIISVVSIGVMARLYVAKKQIGKALNSKPILSDAECTKICIYMSFVLLVSSIVYQLTGFAYADVLGTAGLIWFSVSEGREAFEGVEAN